MMAGERWIATDIAAAHWDKAGENGLPGEWTVVHYRGVICPSPTLTLSYPSGKSLQQPGSQLSTGSEITQFIDPTCRVGLRLLQISHCTLHISLRYILTSS